MSVLDRQALEASPLADLHVIAGELGLDGFRRLRKADLIDAILARQGGDGADEAGRSEPRDAEAEPDGEARPRPRRRRGGRGRGRRADGEGERGDERASEDRAPDEPERIVEGTVELLANGSGFVRVAPPDPSDDDVYVSASQVRRCELVSGDVVTGPARRPRRSERYPSLIRVDTINGSPADEVAEGTRYDDLPAAFPHERLPLGSEDPTVRALEWLTPFGRGSRVSIVGPPRAGKSEALLRLAAALSGAATEGGYELSVVLAGVRPEEVSLWEAGPARPEAAVPFSASADAQSQAIENAVDQARRRVARGGHVVLLVDTLDALAPVAARRVLGAARRVVDGGSLTILATVTAPLGGETTVIALDEGLAGTRRFPALDLRVSGVLRAELLVGEAGAEAIAKARAEALGL